MGILLIALSCYPSERSEAFHIPRRFASRVNWSSGTPNHNSQASSYLEDLHIRGKPRDVTNERAIRRKPVPVSASGPRQHPEEFPLSPLPPMLERSRLREQREELPDHLNDSNRGKKGTVAQDLETPTSDNISGYGDFPDPSGFLQIPASTGTGWAQPVTLRSSTSIPRRSSMYTMRYFAPPKLHRHRCCH